MGPGAFTFVEPRRGLCVGLLVLRRSFFVCCCPYLCFISFLNLDLYVLRDNPWIK